MFVVVVVVVAAGGDSVAARARVRVCLPTACF